MRQNHQVEANYSPKCQTLRAFKRGSHPNWIKQQKHHRPTLAHQLFTTHPPTRRLHHDTLTTTPSLFLSRTCNQGTLAAVQAEPIPIPLSLSLAHSSILFSLFLDFWNLHRFRFSRTYPSPSSLGARDLHRVEVWRQTNTHTFIINKEYLQPCVTRPSAPSIAALASVALPSSSRACLLAPRPAAGTCPNYPPPSSGASAVFATRTD
ncbi:hypothetical protein B0T10DRAFT_166402 [Thelonectria olida]|uniref:Uncharacterized protein n=1 Tax=Thelonectria olida TaxID=1576542 RepID=A0A9P9AX22_9HYPO|nr:hypothetical protein B0T10DRAFT_166402 [Thelonectria olida]